MTMDEIIDADAPVQEGASPLPILRYAVIEPDSGLVLNIIEAEQDFVLEGATLVLDDDSAVMGGPGTARRSSRLRRCQSRRHRCRP